MIACCAACAIAAVISQIGDLAASAIKRNHQVKDYGTLIPGHGGILDRFDSMMFTAPAIYFCYFIFTVVHWHIGENHEKIALLGSTGSIGTQTLDVVKPGRYPGNMTMACRGSNIYRSVRKTDPGVSSIHSSSMG